MITMKKLNKTIRYLIVLLLVIVIYKVLM